MGIRNRLKRQQKATSPSENSAHSMLEFSKQLLADAGIKDIVISGDNHQIPDRVAHAGPVGGILFYTSDVADE